MKELEYNLSLYKTVSVIKSKGKDGPKVVIN